MIFVGILAGLLISAIGMLVEGEILYASVALSFALFFIFTVAVIKRENGKSSESGRKTP